MVTRCHLTVAILFPLLGNLSVHADIYRWDTGQVIPGTEGIEPGPEVDLSSWRSDQHNLRYADFTGGITLAEARFDWSWLDNADFTGARLWKTSFDNATLTGANFTDAWVSATQFGYVTGGGGFTKEQLYSTASYKSKYLQGIELYGNVLTGWDLSEQVLADADLSRANLTEANLSGANLTNADIRSTRLTRADLTGADLTNAILWEATLTEANLSGVDLTDADLWEATVTDANLSGANLTRAVIRSSTLTRANLTGATVTRADFSDTTSRGFTKEQLYSTNNYQQKGLQGIRLGANDLSGWDFREQSLESAQLGGSVLTDAQLTDANLTRADLANVDLTEANLTRANLTTAWLGNADLSDTQLQSTVFDSTRYNQWTLFPDGFDPVAMGLTFVLSEGDFDADHVLGTSDINMLTTKIGHGSVEPAWLPDSAFDLNNDGAIDLEDRRIWVWEVKNTWYGDANLDGEFNSGDWVVMFSRGKYETGQFAEWGDGDFSGDGIFDSSDIVIAFVDGGHEQGRRPKAAAVPQPGGWPLLLMGLLPWLINRRSPCPV